MHGHWAKCLKKHEGGSKRGGLGGCLLGWATILSQRSKDQDPSLCYNHRTVGLSQKKVPRGILDAILFMCFLGSAFKATFREGLCESDQLSPVTWPSPSLRDTMTVAQPVTLSILDFWILSEEHKEVGVVGILLSLLLQIASNFLSSLILLERSLIGTRASEKSLSSLAQLRISRLIFVLPGRGRRPGNLQPCSAFAQIPVRSHVECL